MRFRSFIYCFAILCCTSSTAQVPHFFTYNSTEGLPQSQVWDAMPDSRGFLWFATQGGGLSRFDGKEFDNFSTSEGLPSDFVHCLAQAQDYGLWIGTEKGLCYYDGRSFHTAKYFEQAVTCLHLDTLDNKLYIGTPTGLYTRDGALEKQNIQQLIPNTPVFCFYKNSHGIWAGTRAGLYNLEQETPTLFGKNEGLLGQGVYAIHEGRNNDLILGLWGLGISNYSIDNQSITRTITHPLLARPLCILFQKKAKTFWVGTQDKGLVLIDENLDEIQQVSETDGLPHNHVRAIVEDQDNQVWVATSGGGVARSLRQNFTHFTERNGLAGERIYAVEEDYQGRLWIAASSAGVQVEDSTGFQSILLPEDFQNIKCKTLCRDQQGRIWVGTEGRGILVIEDIRNPQKRIKPKAKPLLDSLQNDTIPTSPWRFFILNTENGLAENWVQHIRCDQKGQIWAALFNQGIVRIKLYPDKELFSVQRIKDAAQISKRHATALSLDAQNRIWFGTQSGEVGYIEKNKIRYLFNQSDGLPPVPIRTLAFDHQKRLWVGTKGAGIYRATDAQNTEFKAIQQAKRLSSKNIYLLLQDAIGTMWAGNERGVDKVVLNKAGAVEDVFSYGRKEGFLGMETCHNAALSDRKGQLWFGTMNGLMRLIPKEEKQESKPPKVHFEEISLFYKSLDETEYAAYARRDGGLLDGLALPYNKNHLSFAFRAVDLERPEQIRYRWRLNGAEASWSPPSVRQSVNYANLQAGIYTFEVQAGIEAGEWGLPQKVSFEIEKPIWATLGFRLAAAGLLLASIGLFAWSWLRGLKRREAAQRHELEVQNRLLQLEQKALQLQMNPHFIFNALTGIRSLITEKDFTKARSEINEFAKLMRSVLNNSRRSSISLQEEAATLQKYLSIEQFCNDGKFDFSIDLPTDIDLEEVELPPMLLQPFVENAVVHGVSHLPYKGLIEVRFEVEGDFLKCTVRDNGVGREKAAKLQAEKQPGHQSVALQVTKDRLEALRGDLSYKSLDIKDLKSKNETIQGTEVAIRLPLTFNY